MTTKTEADVRIHLIHRRGFDEVLAVSASGTAATSQLLKVAASLVELEIMPSIAPGAWQPNAAGKGLFHARFTVNEEELDGGDLRFALQDVIESGSVDSAVWDGVATTLASEEETAAEVAS